MRRASQVLWSRVALATAIASTGQACMLPTADLAVDGAPFDAEGGTEADGGTNLVRKSGPAGCDAVLVDGVFNELSLSTEMTESVAVRRAFCRRIEEGDETGFDLEVLGMDLVGSRDKEVLEEYCEQFSYQSDREENTSIYVRTVSSTIVENWLSCMKYQQDRVELSCYVTGDNENVLHLSYNGAQFAGRLVNIDPRPDNIELVGSLPDTLSGDFSLPFRLTDPLRDGVLSVNGMTEFTSTSLQCNFTSFSKEAVRQETLAEWKRLWDRLEDTLEWAEERYKQRAGLRPMFRTRSFAQRISSSMAYYPLVKELRRKRAMAEEGWNKCQSINECHAPARANYEIGWERYSADCAPDPGYWYKGYWFLFPSTDGQETVDSPNGDKVKARYNILDFDRDAFHQSAYWRSTWYCHCDFVGEECVPGKRN